jgi:hypothetical protein
MDRSPTSLTPDERAALTQELRSLDEEIQWLRAEVETFHDDLREPDEASAARMAVEQLLLIDSLAKRRDALRRQLDGTTAAQQERADVDGLRKSVLFDPYDELEGVLPPGRFPNEGRGEEVDPAVWPEEWTGPHSDQLTEAVDVDDPVEALEIGALSAGAEAGPYSDITELADIAAPTPPEEAALHGRARTPSDADHMTVGLPPEVDLDRLEDLSMDDLIEAELVAIDEGDPETAAILLSEIEERRKRK